MQLQTHISNKDFPKFIKELLEKEVDDVLDEALDELRSATLRERRAAAQDIMNRLNEFERRNPRKDPALRGLRTDQWRAYIYEVKAPKGQKVRNAKGQFDSVYRVQIWNMQKPFYYRFDFGRFVDRTKGGKMMLDIQSGSVNSLKRDSLHTDLYQMPYADRGSDYLYHRRGAVEPFSTGKSSKSGGKKVNARTKRAYVGNLAAVRLSQASGKVVPLTKQNHTHRIVFWNNGKARRLDKSGKKSIKGTPYNVEGYVFVTSRNKTGPGHRWYYNQVTSIINAGINKWIDNIWQM